MLNEKTSDVATTDPKLDDYQLDNHVDTMQKAQDIMSDPKLMKAVHKHAKGKLGNLKKVTSMLKPSSDDEADDDMNSKPVSSIDDIRSAKKSMKNKLFGQE
jgi:hypothetical protein